MVDGGVVVRVVSSAEFSCVDGALDAASSSESSELKPVRGISEMIGRDGGRDVDSGIEVDLCFFLGCWSSVGVERCFDRTGTGVVIRVVARGRPGTGVVPGGEVEVCPPLGTGFRVVASRLGLCSASSRG